jgi:hypothetical protein
LITPHPERALTKRKRPLVTPYNRALSTRVIKTQLAKYEGLSAEEVFVHVKGAAKEAQASAATPGEKRFWSKLWATLDKPRKIKSPAAMRKLGLSIMKRKGVYGIAVGGAVMAWAAARGGLRNVGEDIGTVTGGLGRGLKAVGEAAYYGPEGAPERGPAGPASEDPYATDRQRMMQAQLSEISHQRDMDRLVAMGGLASGTAQMANSQAAMMNSLMKMRQMQQEEQRTKEQAQMVPLMMQMQAMQARELSDSEIPIGLNVLMEGLMSMGASSMDVAGDGRGPDQIRQEAAINLSRGSLNPGMWETSGM